MRDGEIAIRAKMAQDTFDRESGRCRGDKVGMANLLAFHAAIARCVGNGEYHRDNLFGNIVATLRRMGFDMSHVDTDRRHRSVGIAKAVRNAVEDTNDLYAVTRGQCSEHPLEFAVLSAADDVMRAAGDEEDIARCAWRLHEAVTEYICGTDERADGRSCDEPLPVVGHKFEATVQVLAADPPTDREVPGRVIFSPPATVAFWPDGSKTVAKCAEGEEFSEYTGLLVAIAKRHTAVPRRATFEDVMARLLRRAERQVPRSKASEVEG